MTTLIILISTITIILFVLGFVTYRYIKKILDFSFKNIGENYKQMLDRLEVIERKIRLYE